MRGPTVQRRGREGPKDVDDGVEECEVYVDEFLENERPGRVL